MTDKPQRFPLLRYAAVLVLGVLAGASGLLFVYGREIEELKIENRNLQLVLDKRMEELENLRQRHKAAERRRDVIIDEIEVTIADPKPDPLTEAEVISRLRKDVAYVKGMRADEVAKVHLLLHELLKRREYRIEGRTVEVRIKTVAISRTLHVFVTAVVKGDPIG